MIEAKQIDWSLVPYWAEYVAMDYSGRARAYKLCPEPGSNFAIWSSMGDMVYAPELDDYIDRSQWRSSLVRRPAKYNPDDVVVTVGGEEVEAPTQEFNAWMEKEQEKFNEVTRPSHYVIKDGVEVIDVREWWLQCIADYQIETMRMHDPDVIDGLETISHLERAMEYLLRAPGKGGMEDVRKAYQYLHRALHGEWPK